MNREKSEKIVNFCLLLSLFLCSSVKLKDMYLICFAYLRMYTVLNLNKQDSLSTGSVIPQSLIRD